MVVIRSVTWTAVESVAKTSLKKDVVGRSADMLMADSWYVPSRLRLEVAVLEARADPTSVGSHFNETVALSEGYDIVQGNDPQYIAGTRGRAG